MEQVNIIGGGLAGCEAAWQLATHNIPVTLYEMRKGGQSTAAHETDHLAELVCSNSFRSDDATANAVGVLHEELRQLGSLIMQMADLHKVPAGGALAVDRGGFSQAVEEKLASHPLITICHQEVTTIPDSGEWIIATGPLTSDALSASLMQVTGAEHFAFFDAISPILYTDSIDMDTCWFQSRYDKGEGKDYINCPMNQEEYKHFISTLLDAEQVAFKEWEKDTPYFEGCLPIEVMAQRGVETLRFGPMKPVGLTNPHRDEKAYAVVQLRQDNQEGTLVNIVGFQTKLTYKAQKEVFTSIPGLKDARFARLGSIHRNSFIDSPRLLDTSLRLVSHPHIRFAGQITGVEGYVESTAMGLLAGLFYRAERQNVTIDLPPQTTAIGALLHYITAGSKGEFQPMNVNFGLLASSEEKLKKKERKPYLAKRALMDCKQYVAQIAKEHV